MAVPINGHRDVATTVQGPIRTKATVAGLRRTTMAFVGKAVTRATSAIIVEVFALSSTVTTTAVAVTATRCTPGNSAIARSLCWWLASRAARSCASGCGNEGIQAPSDRISRCVRKSFDIAAQRIDRFDATTALTVNSSRCYASAVDPWLHGGQLVRRAHRSSFLLACVAVGAVRRSQIGGAGGAVPRGQVGGAAGTMRHDQPDGACGSIRRDGAQLSL